MEIIAKLPPITVASWDGRTVHYTMQADAYLADRATFLERKLWFSTEDKKQHNPANDTFWRNAA